MHAAPGRSRGVAQISSFLDAVARRGAPLGPRKAGGSCCCNLSSSGNARPPHRRFSSSSPSPTPTPTPSSSRRRLPLPPARSSFSRIPIESLDYERASDGDRRRRKAARRRRHEDDDDDDEHDDDGHDADYDDADFGDGERKRKPYSDASFSDDEDASGLEPGFPDAALPGSQVARLKDLAAQSAARRDYHWRYYKAQSAKSNLLSAVVLACTTAGGTSGLISLTQATSSIVPPAGGGFSGLVPDASMFHGMTSAAAQAAREAAAAAAATAAANAANASGSHTAALLSPVLGYAATLVSGLQNYSKPSTAASR